MAKMPRKEVVPFKAQLLKKIAESDGITGAQLAREYPPTERTTVYRFLRNLREEGLIQVENLSRREYAHTITEEGKKWLQDTATGFQTLSDKLLGALRM
jgi:DNA-binding PadR family transcriptional regulator